MSETTENLPTVTLTQAFDLYHMAKAEAEERVREAMVAESEALELIASVAGDKTFTYKGELFQVRKRMNKMVGHKLAFLCKLKVEPAEWLAAARAKRVEDALEAATQAEIDAIQPEGQAAMQAQEEEPNGEEAIAVLVDFVAVAIEEEEEVWEQAAEEEEMTGSVDSASLFDGDTGTTVMLD